MAKTILLEKGSWNKRKKITIHARVLHLIDEDKTEPFLGNKLKQKKV